MLCGPTCVQILAKKSGIELSDEALAGLQRYTSMEKGTSIANVRKLLKQVGVGDTRQLSNMSVTNLEDAVATGRPAIALLKPRGGRVSGHFIVVENSFYTNGGRMRWFTIIDPTDGSRWIVEATSFMERFTGNAIVTRAVSSSVPGILKWH